MQATVALLQRGSREGLKWELFWTRSTSHTCVQWNISIRYILEEGLPQSANTVCIQHCTVCEHIDWQHTSHIYILGRHMYKAVHTIVQVSHMHYINIYMQTPLLKWQVFHQGLHISRTERSCGILTGVEHWFWDWAALSYKTGEGGQVLGLSNSSLCLEETLFREFLGSWERSIADRGRDLSKWLSRRDPRVLSIQSQESSRLWTSCMHWIYPVLYLCWASASKTGSECMGKYF